MTGHVPTEDGAVIEVEYASSIELSAGTTTITALPTGVQYDPNTIKFDLYDKVSGTKYTEGTNYTIDWTATPGIPAISWTSTPPVTDTVVYVRQGTWSGPIADPTRTFTENNYSTNRNEFILEYVSGDDVLQSLGLVDSSGAMQNVTAAQNAIINVNGIEVTRSENTIEDLIAGVKLELVGLGDVTMNIVQDTEKAVKAVQAFIDAYNEVMTWINDKLEEKYSSTAAVDDDYLQNLLSSTDKSTVFGVLHGDQLLSSIKNQLRNMVSNSVVNTSLALATKKYLHTDTDLKLEGEFYVYAGGQALRIDVKDTDSLEDIRDKILSYFSVTSKDGTKPTSDDLKLNAFIRDGQLVVEYNSASTLTSPRVEYIARNNARLDGGTGGDYDILPFTATTEPPISGKFTVQVGEATTDGMGNTVPPKYYYEGVDFEIENVWTTNSAATPPVSMLESRIKWISADKPSDDATYKLTYEYNPTGVAYSVISTSSDDEKNLKKLELHTDTSKSQLSSFGIKTTLVDDEFGKRGLLEFNSDTLIAALAADDNTTSSVMTGFFRSLDTYIGNLVDSSNVIVGGTSVTKGRVAAAMLTIDNEVNTLTAQISKLEKQLADRQTAMYKQYSDMEMAIQKLNAQMSSISQYLTNTSSS
jgi:flagellar hook-associated protein 2